MTTRIYIVSDRGLNAFVAGGQNIFINAGMIMRLGTVDQLRSVVAHEIGHITGGHLARRDEALKGARGVAAIGMLGGALAAASGSSAAGMAIMATSQQAALRSALAHSRAEEAAADQSGLRYMAAAGAQPGAALEVQQLFQRQEALTGRRSANSYGRTHPLWQERIALIEARIAELPEGRAPSDEDVYWHARMVAKFRGFMDAPADTLRTYPESDSSEPAMLARAVAWHRMPDPARAIAAADALIEARPEDPYYHELRGQFLLEAGRAGPAADSYRQAVALAPFEALILGGLGRALLNTDEPAATREARDVLARSVALDKADVGVLRDLALAEARLGNDGAAALATAERHLVEGRFNDAMRQAIRASDLLPTGGPGWRQAQDVLTVARRAQN